MPAMKSSAELVTALWDRFATQFQKNYPNHTLTKRYGSLYVINDDDIEGDTHALARWTNPGERPNWRIPLKRIPKVASKLKASQEEVDELMLARLFELEETHGTHDALTAAAWGYDIAERTHALTPDEEAVLKAYRQGTTVYPFRLFDNEESQQLLRMLFERLADKSLKELEPPEDDAEPETSEERERRRQKADAVLAILRANAATKRCEQVEEMKQNGMRMKNRIKKLLKKF